MTSVISEQKYTNWTKMTHSQIYQIDRNLEIE